MLKTITLSILLCSACHIAAQAPRQALQPHKGHQGRQAQENRTREEARRLIKRANAIFIIDDSHSGRMMQKSIVQDIASARPSRLEIAARYPANFAPLWAYYPRAPLHTYNRPPNNRQLIIVDGRYIIDASLYSGITHYKGITDSRHLAGSLIAHYCAAGRYRQ